MDYQQVYENSVKEYISKTSNSQKKHDFAKQYMPGGDTRSVAFFKPYPITIDRGNGAYLYDADGNRYIDFLNNYTSLVHGHAHPAIVEKVRSVLDKGTAYAAPIEEQAQLAELLCKRVPSVDRVRFCNSGTEAVMFAIRAARAFTGKAAIIKMEGGFHGTIDLMENSIAPTLPHPQDQDPWAPVSDCKGNSPNAARDLYIAPYNNAEVVEEILKAKSNEIAAILLEPVMGQTGAIAARPEYLKKLRKLADQYHVLLIFDEIQSLRIDLGGVQNKLNIIPDLTSMGKFIGGGFPVAAFGGREDIMNLYNPMIPGYISHSGTFNGNKVGMAAGIVSVNLLDKDAIQRLEKMSIELENQIKSAIANLKIPVSVNRAGSLMHVHFVKECPVDYASTKGPFKDLTKVMHMKLLNHGIFIAPRGSMNLSTVMTDKDIEEASKAFSDVLSEMVDLFN